jgi:hypothetical protein
MIHDLIRREKEKLMTNRSKINSLNIIMPSHLFKIFLIILLIQETT